MTIHVLVEGPSERTLIEPWSARLLAGERVTVHPHQGKGRLPADLNAAPRRTGRGLLDQLPATLRGYSEALDPQSDGVVVLLDADDDNPDDLKASIEAAVSAVAPNLRVHVLVAVEETEAFYLGDLRGLKRAFPGADMKAAQRYEPDSICGTWELFGKIVGDGGGNKVAWASSMAPNLTIQAKESRSPSFKTLVAALLELSKVAAESPKRPTFRHLPRRKDHSGKR